MEQFLKQNKLPYRLVWDPLVLGVKTRRTGKAFSRHKRFYASFTGERPQNERGPPGGFEFDCSFCAQPQKTFGKLKQHFERTHYRSFQMQVKLPKAGFIRFCPIEDRHFAVKDTRTLKKHLADVN